MTIKTQTYREKRKEFIVDSWYNALKQIKNRKGRVARVSEFIKAINNAESINDIWPNGAYTAAGLDYAPNAPVLLLRNNAELLKLENAEKVYSLHRDYKEYPITQNAYHTHLRIAERSVKKAPEERTILILPERSSFEITPQNYFDVLRFLAEDSREAEKYMERFLEEDIKSKCIEFYIKEKDYVDKQNSPFTNQLWVHWRIAGSCFDGRFGLGHGVLGVFQKSREASQKIFSRQELEDVVREAMNKMEKEVRAREMRSFSEIGFLGRNLLEISAEIWAKFLGNRTFYKK